MWLTLVHRHFLFPPPQSPPLLLPSVQRQISVISHSCSVYDLLSPISSVMPLTVRQQFFCQSPVYLTSPSRGHCSNTIQIKLPVMCTTDHVNVILQHHRILNSVSLVRMSTFLWPDTTRQHHDRAGGKTESSFRLKYHSQAIVKGHSTKQLTCSGKNFQR